VTERDETRLWIAQRASAAVLAVFVAVHLVTMIVAVKGGLNAADILGRTRGSVAWALFYALFVLAVAVHAPIGLRNIAAEWLQWRGSGANLCCMAIGALLLALGWYAVAAVTL
jgi:fumarate reductase subunit C